MKRYQIFLLVLAAFSIGGWAKTRRPASPTDSMPLVIYAGFEVKGATDDEGRALAEKAATWDGVRTTTFNPGSKILAVARLESVWETALLERLRMAAPATARVEKKVFAASPAPQCPVPMGLILALPSWLLGFGAVFLGLFAASFFGSLKKEKA